MIYAEVDQVFNLKISQMPFKIYSSCRHFFNIYMYQHFVVGPMTYKTVCVCIVIMDERYP